MMQTMMRLHIMRQVSVLSARRTRIGDLVMRGLITGTGASVFLLLAWVHLGLGALLFAPPATPPRMVATAGPYVVTLFTVSGQFVTGDGNAITLDVSDRTGAPVANALVRVHADMMTMPMPVPDEVAAARGNGQYSVRLVFSMSGPWRLTITVAVPGKQVTTASFDVGVRWSQT